MNLSSIVLIIIIIIIIIFWFGDSVTVTHLTKCNTYSKVRASHVSLTNQLHLFLQGAFHLTASTTRMKAQAWPQFNRHVLYAS